ncbi:gluconokinase [Methylobacterium haplocladii]|uniref:Gluconokinase n=1 Tax=Methylobacterium haplocladii TaxID=1176176 RepID=A0A512IUG6_9HYPH|nr:gluconokinase [Methylobacterium haplocladii]GEP01342.1 gluconokinase [Methylobacterium haplocladii]GLS59955.1 gluconokinase [Methylobacterium haplocladii]
MPDPTVLVVMGVSGSGKSTVAGLLAQRLGWAFVDGDDFHSPEHVARMQGGRALTDAERRPWLVLVGAWIEARLAAGTSGVIVCSALRRSYRDVLVQGRPAVRIVYLEGSRALIADRLGRRRDHFMPAGLLDSQFAALEPPGPEERPITVGIEDGPEAIAAAIATRLGFSQDS